MKPDDRVLLLAMPEPDDLLALARKLTDGLIAVLVDNEQVYEGRRIARDCENVMFTAWDGHVIPWRDGFFTLVCAPGTIETTPEVSRVLAPGGVLMVSA